MDERLLSMSDEEFAVEAKRRQMAADRQLSDDLDAAEAAGELTTHEWGQDCTLGLWHTGPCE